MTLFAGPARPGAKEKSIMKILFKYRLFILIFIPAALALTAGMLLIQEKNASLSEAQFESQLKNQWRLAALIAEDPDIRAELPALYEQHGLRVTLLDEKGEALYDNAAATPLEPHGDREEIRKAMAGSPAMTARQSETTGRHSIYYAERLPDGRALRVSYPASYYEEQKRALPEQALSGLLVLLFLVALFAALVMRRENAMLASLSQAVKTAQAGGQNLPAFDNADIDEALFALSAANRELTRLEENSAQLSQRLEYILESVNEGVLLIEDSRVVYHNRRAEELLDFKLAKKAMDIHDQEMMKIFAALSGGQEGPMRFGDRSLIVSQTLSGAGRLIILRDVSDEEKYSGYKSDLVGNISHELKTPLTLIMGASEVILKDPAMPREYLDKFLTAIHKNSGRINLLLDDLIFLHRLENNPGDEIRETSLAELEEELKALLGHLEKRVVYDFDETSVRINAPHLISVLSNLITNAEKYSSGDSIFASAKKRGHLLEIRVSDQGPAIPAAERERIFERFYTLSKSRHRAQAGSGLGLAIVKQETEEGGNCFVVRLLEK